MGRRHSAVPGGYHAFCFRSARGFVPICQGYLNWHTAIGSCHPTLPSPEPAAHCGKASHERDANSDEPSRSADLQIPWRLGGLEMRKLLPISTSFSPSTYRHIPVLSRLFGSPLKTTWHKVDRHVRLKSEVGAACPGEKLCAYWQQLSHFETAKFAKGL